MNTLKEYIYNRHDVVCNQKYGKDSPYSFHLECVLAQARKFEYLLKGNEWDDIVYPAVLSHDTLEGDARMTYNNLITALKRYKYSNAVDIADVVYCLTDEKGKNRAERKNDKYYRELKVNELAVFVKLCDISANTLYSKLTGSSMYDKYKKEFPGFKFKVFTARFEDLFQYVENL